MTDDLTEMSSEERVSNLKLRMSLFKTKYPELFPEVIIKEDPPSEPKPVRDIASRLASFRTTDKTRTSRFNSTE